MRHIKTFSTVDIESILEKFNLVTSPTELDLRDGITNYVFNKCEHLIPEKLASLIREKADYGMFRDEIKEHLEFNSMMLQLNNEPTYITSNYNLLKEMLQKLNEICEKNQFLKYTSSVQYYKEKKLEKKIAKDYDLRIEKETNTTFNQKNKKQMIPQVKVPSFAAPFIFFTTLNHDIYNDYNLINVESFEFFRERAYLYTQFLELYKENADISLYLFEKEYHLHLIDSILEGLVKISDFHKVNALRVLSLASLLPNIRGRSHYISVLCDSVFEMKYDFDESGGYGSKSHTIFESKESRETIWLQRTTTILLEMALLVFPIMELYHYHLCQQRKQKINTKAMYCGYLNNNKHSKNSMESVIKCIQLIESTYEKYHINNFIKTKTLEVCTSEDGFENMIFDPIENLLNSVVLEAYEIFFREFTILN